MREKAVVAWSGGKDSALALYEVLNSGSYQVLDLFTTVTKDNDRISIHDVQRILLELQARALCIPLEELFIILSSSKIFPQNTQVNRRNNRLESEANKHTRQPRRVLFP